MAEEAIDRSAEAVCVHARGCEGVGGSRLAGVGRVEAVGWVGWGQLTARLSTATSTMGWPSTRDSFKV